MYKGVPAPPRYLHWFISSDGEASYFLTEMEMFGALLATGLILAVVIQVMRRHGHLTMNGWKRSIGKPRACDGSMTAPKHTNPSTDTNP